MGSFPSPPSAPAAGVLAAVMTSLAQRELHDWIFQRAIRRWFELDDRERKDRGKFALSNPVEADGNRSRSSEISDRR